MPELKMKIAVTSTHRYVGQAVAGTATSQPDWQIMRQTLATSDIEWAEQGEFKAVWDNRESSSYA